MKALFSVISSRSRKGFKLLPLLLSLSASGCAVVAVADAGISVAAAAVSVGASAVGAAADVAGAGVRAITGSGKK
jgi:hypothetical protein